MKIMTCIFFITLICQNAWTQTIINVEKIKRYTKEGFYFGCEAGIELESGNSNVLEVEEVSVIGYQTKKHWIRLFTGMEFLKGEDDDLIQRMAGQLRYNYIISSSWRLFLFYQHQHNQLVLLKRRRLIGVGIRKSFRITDAVSFDLGSGIMYETEHLDDQGLTLYEDAVSNCLRLSNLIVLTAALSPAVNMVNVSYFQPRISHLPDFRFFDEISLLFMINKKLGATLSLVYRYDNRPPSSVKCSDLSFKNGMILRF